MHLNTTSWLSACCIFTRHNNGEVCPVASGLEVGGSAAGRGWGRRVGVSLQPINSALTKHLREISHAPLASCAENQRRGPPEKGIPSGQTGNTTPDEGQHMVLKESDLSKKLFNSEGRAQKKFSAGSTISCPLSAGEFRRMSRPQWRRFFLCKT